MRGGPRPQECRYGILFSHASTQVYEDHIGPNIYPTRLAAYTQGNKIALLQGIQYEVMEKVDGQWRSRKGEIPTEVIRRRWQ